MENASNNSKQGNTDEKLMSETTGSENDEVNGEEIINVQWD